MLERLIKEQKPRYLATYTRNPAIIKMIARECSRLYPLDYDDTLLYMAQSMASATSLDGVVYHENRYSPDGLFVGDDPADRAIDEAGLSLKQRFPVLSSVRNALVIVGEVERRKS